MGLINKLTGNLKIKYKVLIPCTFLVVLTALVIVVITIVQKNRIAKEMSEELSKLALAETEKIAKDVYLMCRAQNESVQKMVDADLNVARSVLNNNNGVSFSKNDMDSWQITNQLTGESRTVELPGLTIGGSAVEKSKSFDTRSPIVDEVKALVGGTCTVFQRINEEGDMLRVLTNVRKTDGTRAIGTYIPRTSPDGKQNPVVSAVLGGNTYRGTAYVVDSWYVTAYEPIWDKDRARVVGALYVGVKQESVESLRKGIMEVVVGKSGYVYVLGGNGDQKGKYIISKDGKRDGENIWEAKDADGKPFIQEVITKGVTTKNGSAEFVSYPWKNEGEDKARVKVAAVTYFEPWDWVIGAGAYYDDYLEAQQSVANSLRNMIAWVIGVALVIAVFSVMISWVVANGISKPIGTITEASKKMKDGVIDLIEIEDTKDEVGEMATAFNEMAHLMKRKVELAESISAGDLTMNVDIASEKDVLGLALKNMVENLRRVISDINASMFEVATGSSQVSDTSQSLSQGATEQAASLEEISSSINELSHQTKENAENAGMATTLSQDAKIKAEEGGLQMKDMVSAMGEISDSSKEVAKVIKVIDDIAFQTNLLALNAAVEAARAGRYGKGFAVVAEEVRNLAGRSAKAATETAELIETSVKKAENGTALAMKSIEGFSDIVEGTKKAAELVKVIASASNEQAQGISEISVALSQIDKASQLSTASSEELASTSEELSSQATQVTHVLKQFRTGEEHDVNRSKKDRDSNSRPERKKSAYAADSEWGAAAPGSRNNSAARRDRNVEDGRGAREEQFAGLDDSDFGRF